MSASSPHYSFVPDPHSAQYLAMDARTNDRSPSPARKFWPFNRSRSSSPNTQQQLHVDTSFNSTRSRRSSNNSPAISPSGSASSFVVRSVIRNPGGVSMPGSPANDTAQPFFGQPNSPARRMTLEDSDDEQPQHGQLHYRRSKSKPLGAAPASLGVPPGGPGGGIGYGTAHSSNDGRPEAAGAQPSPYHRPASPSASIKAGEFNRANQRGRSPRKSVSAASASDHDPRSASAHSAASGKKPVARITAGPKSLAQQQHEMQHQQLDQSSRGPSPAAGPRQAGGLAGPRQFPVAAPAGFGLPPMQPPSMPHAQDARDESPSRSRRFSFGIGRTRKDSDTPAAPTAAAAPLDGLPSPVDIPYGRSPHSPLRFDAGADTDYSRANSPFGSVSPARVAGSPNSSGFINTLMGRQSSADHTPSRDDNVPRSCSPGGGSHLAGKWFKGVFGRSPRADEKDAAYADGVLPYPARDAEDEAAVAQKMASMRQARHIVDQERQQWMSAQTPTRAAEFRPRQVVDGDDEDEDAALEHELGRKKSPPGRKPVPAYLPGATVESTPAAASDEPLTPAQRIIHETRSKQLAREQIEAQRKHAADQQTQLRQTRHTQLPPATPPKSTSATGGHGKRFPSGAHQLTREPVHAHPAGAASTLSPGSGPMPAEMGLRDALQEMMVRFYRFERYSVPLIRALERRLVDIERDAMLASNPHARGSVGSASSAHSAEMDRWVTQMTGLMKHEVGQLKAATREISEARELVAHVARTSPQEAAKSAAVPVSTSMSSFGSIHAVTPSASVQPMPQVLESPAKARQTNVSSSTFESAVPRAGAGAAGVRNLVLPAGAKPALDKDEGKHSTASPTKAIFGFASESVRERDARERSVSPNGRPRFTSVLGQPLVHGRLSPGPTSPSAESGMKRDVSVEDRLKALVDGASTRSRSSSFASAAPATLSNAEEEDDDSGAADITAALAAIEATSHGKKPSTHTLDTLREPVAVTKSASHSSSGSVEEPLTPPLEDAPSAPGASPVKTRALSYLSTAAAMDEPKCAPAVASGRISPNKLFAHKFAATASTASAHSAHSANSTSSPSAKLGLVEKKRFTLGAPVSPVSNGRLSRTPSATFEDTATVAPTSAAFSALAKVKPVGHTATLRERVAFFDTAK
ncbi:hypothetical protein PaG_04264 [Moesziomyces aphidis]|uniref:Uncharacterized protein n=1 Tax=Moesziomyces aphidis TaxID=84754 RepID=W3VL30_MOEAP|nr:hypothetical protein PaG_04264 [Moesziomyces aphidis]